jgi:hypothetical protein
MIVAIGRKVTRYTLRSYLVISRAQNPLGTYDMTYCLLNTLFSVYAAIFIARAITVLTPWAIILRLPICCSGSKDGTNKCSVINGRATSNLFKRSIYSCMNFEGKRSLRNNWERSEDRITPEKEISTTLSKRTQNDYWPASSPGSNLDARVRGATQAVNGAAIKAPGAVLNSGFGESTLDIMNHSPINQNFELNKSRQKFHHSLKEHHKISNIPKFRCKML